MVKNVTIKSYLPFFEAGMTNNSSIILKFVHSHSSYTNAADYCVESAYTSRALLSKANLRTCLKLTIIVQRVI